MDFGEWELKSYKELSTDIRFRDSYQAWIDRWFVGPWLTFLEHSAYP